MGRDNEPLSRNTPTLYNLRWATVFNWDGSAKSLEAQALGPILAANELAGDMAGIVKRVSEDDALIQAYAKAFPDDRAPESDGLLAALSAYTRTLVSPATRFDVWISGKAEALTEIERMGFDIFTGKGGCVACHVGWRFTDDKLHDIGLAAAPAVAGRATAQAGVKHGNGPASPQPGAPGMYAFKTPTLRALPSTAPYMHDGRFASLAEVVEHYAEQVEVRRGLAPNLAHRLELTPGEKAKLIAFLKTL